MDAVHLTGGDPQAGYRLIREVGCAACHTIPGIKDPQGLIGPPLTAWSKRTYIAGHLPNEPMNLVAWVMDARSVAPDTAMPNLDLSEAQARDVAAYLYTID